MYIVNIQKLGGPYRPTSIRFRTWDGATSCACPYMNGKARYRYKTTITKDGKAISYYSHG